MESLGLRISKSEVSRIAGLLDGQVTAFRQRPLEGRYPYVFVDAKIEKVRDGGRVAHKCVVIAHAVHETGRREIIGLDVGEAETEAFWTEFLRSLVARGLVGSCTRSGSASNFLWPNSSAACSTFALAHAANGSGRGGRTAIQSPTSYGTTSVFGVRTPRAHLVLRRSKECR